LQTHRRYQPKEERSVETADFTEERENLLQSIERDQEEVRVAVQELTGAARAKLSVNEQIKELPLTWAIGAFLVGAWLGSRSAARDVAAQRGS
jgi:hypothetical protein